MTAVKPTHKQNMHAIQLTDYLSSTHLDVDPDGKSVAERNRAEAFDMRVQENRSKYASEDVAMFAKQAAQTSKKLTVAGWLVKLTTGVPGFKVPIDVQ